MNVIRIILLIMAIVSGLTTAHTLGLSEEMMSEDTGAEFDTLLELLGRYS